MADLIDKLPPFFGPAGIWAGFLVLAATIIRVAPSMFQTKTAADGSLRGDLLAQIKQLNERHDKLEADRVTDRERCDAEIQVLRHRLNNETMSLDALLMLMEAAPERLRENIAKIKELRAERARTIALEQGALAGAKVAGGKERT